MSQSGSSGGDDKSASITVIVVTWRPKRFDAVRSGKLEVEAVQATAAASQSARRVMSLFGLSALE